MLPPRRSQIGRIEQRIKRLDARAADLLAGENRAVKTVTALRQDLDATSGALLAMRKGRRLRRRQSRLERLRSKRSGLVDRQLRVIMFALQDESRRTRDELDRELARLVPVQERWERLRATFDALEATMDRPAFAALADQWRGQLEIPEFPVAQRGGYAKPFPQGALLF
jgi:SMC interacting uncharacterized protein involved in chromosome segregation